MKKPILIAFLFLSGIMATCSAQQKAPYTLLKLNTGLFTYHSAATINLFNNSLATPQATVPAMRLTYSLPKGAIFCRMEDALYKHLNFWIKFRMGTDDRYSN